MLRLSHVEAILRASRIITPVPSRQTLIHYIEDGTLVGHKDPATGYYLVTEQSFKAWVKSFQPDAFVLRP